MAITPPDPSAAATKWLASGLTVITGSAAVFGASTGSLGRVIRDDPNFARGWLAIALVAVGLGIIVPAVVEKVPNMLILIGAAFLLLSVYQLGTRMATDQSRSQRPQVDGALSTTKDELKVTGKVKANGLRSTDYMLIQVDQHTTKTKQTVTLYSAFVGPNGDGHVNAPIGIAAGRDAFDRIVISGQVVGKVDETKLDQPPVELCDTSLKYRGCAVMSVPAKPASAK